MDLRIAQERRLNMTLALSQALSILQMPQLELAAWLREEIEKNPLLEMDAPERTPPRQAPTAEVAASITLGEVLAEQVRETISSELDRSIAAKIIDSLDDRGFFIGSIDEIAAFYRVSPTRVESVLSTIQTFQPPGIGARSLQESLLLQLRAQGLGDSPSFALVRDGFDDLLHGRYHLLKKNLQIPDLSLAIARLARLSMRPSASFPTEPVPLAYADLSMVQIDGKWSIQPIEDVLPRFHFRSDYLTVPTKSVEEKRSLQTHATSAKWLIRSLGRRRKLLCEVGRLIVKKQAAYFEHRAPLTLLSARELAEELGVHESTLSRAISGKFIETPRGFLPLKALISSDPTKELLERLVAQEDKNRPWTDAELAVKLTEQGHPTMRRTVAKYRSQIKIGSATQRKNRKPTEEVSI